MYRPLWRENRSHTRVVQKFLGTESWEWAGSSIRTAGPQILIEATMDYKPGKERGIFAGLLPDITTLPKLVWMAPHGTEEKPAAFVACHVRIDKLYNLFLEVVGNLFRDKQRPLAEIKAEVKKEMGFDFETEFLAHVSTEVLGLLHIDEDVERDRAAPDADGLCFVVRITNDEGFEAVYKKLRVHPDLRPGAAQEIAGGEAIPIRMLDRGEYIGRTKKLFFYAVGDRGLEVMKAFLRQNAKAGEQPQLPKVVQRTFRNTPPGWNAVGVLPTRWLQDPMTESVLWEIWREVGWCRCSNTSVAVIKS